MIPIPRVPVSQQSYGQFAAPTAAPMQDAGPQQLQQLGASLLNAGASAARIGADLQADLDQGFLMESDALASELARNTVGSYRQLAGLPAIEAFGDTQEQLRTKLRNLSDTARSPEQKQRLERILVQRMQDAGARVVAEKIGVVAVDDEVGENTQHGQGQRQGQRQPHPAPLALGIADLHHEQVDAGGKEQDQRVADAGQAIGPHRVLQLEQNGPAGLPQRGDHAKQEEAQADAVEALLGEDDQPVPQEHCGDDRRKQGIHMALPQPQRLKAGECSDCSGST